MTGRVRRIEIIRMVASGAFHTGCAMTIGATHHQRLMRASRVGLTRAIAGGMAIHATRMHEHLAGFLEQRHRARTWVTDIREG